MRRGFWIATNCNASHTKKDITHINKCFQAVSCSAKPRHTCGGASVTPRVGLTTLPYCRIWLTIPFTVSTGTAIPVEGFGAEATLGIHVHRAI